MSLDSSGRAVDMTTEIPIVGRFSAHEASSRLQQNTTREGARSHPPRGRWLHRRHKSEDNGERPESARVAALLDRSREEASSDRGQLLRVERWPHFNNVGILACCRNSSSHRYIGQQFDRQILAGKRGFRGIRGCHHRMRDLRACFGLAGVTNGSFDGTATAGHTSWEV